MAWFDDLNLPGSTVTGHFAFVLEDGPDVDDAPDVQLASGTVRFRATAPAVRSGGAWVGISPVTAQIFDGELVVSEEDPRPVRLLSTDADTGVEGWGWEASFDIRGASIKPISFRAPAAGVHLTGDDLIPITGLPVEVIANGALARLVTAEDLLAAHGARLTAVESTVTAHAARLDALEDTTAGHGTRLTAVESLAAATETATMAVDAKASATADKLGQLVTTVNGLTSTVTAPLAAGASAGIVTLTKTGRNVVADLSGVVLTGTSEVVVTIPMGMRPGHKAGHGYTEDTANGWWPTRATTTQVQVMGPAPAGTTVEGSISWTISS